MDIIFSVVLTLLLAAVLTFLFVNLASLGKKKESRIPNLYAIAIMSILNDELDAAAKALKELIRKDSSNVEAYLNLGIIFRKQGKINNAIKAHQNLLYRQNLTLRQKVEILRNLCEDYLQAGDYETALKYSLQILEIEPHNRWALEETSQIYKELNLWAKAAEYLEKLESLQFSINPRLLALYRIQEGLEKYNRNEYHEARVIFRKALKIDPNCEAAYYYIGQAYIKDNRESDSIEWFVKFADLAPDKAYLVFEPLQNILYKMGNFGNIETFYQNLLHKRPNDPIVLEALARFYLKKGDLRRAKETIEALIDHNPEFINGKILMAKLLLVQDKTTELAELLNNIVDSGGRHLECICSNCKYSSKEAFWICPNCGKIETCFK